VSDWLPVRWPDDDDAAVALEDWLDEGVGDFTGLDLRGADLTGAPLSGAVLLGADLRGVVLRRAELDGAQLTSADLRGADLAEAQLQDANLDDANPKVGCARGLCLPFLAELTHESTTGRRMFVKLLIAAITIEPHR